MNKVKTSIYRKLVIKIILFSSLVTVFSTFFQLYNDYISDVKRIENIQYDVLFSHSESLELALWSMDLQSIDSQIEGILNVGTINNIRIITTEGDTWNKGDNKQDYKIENSIELKHRYLDKKDIPLGSVIIQSDLFVVYQHLLEKALVIFISNGIKTFLVAVFIVFLVKSMITTPLSTIANYFKKYTPLKMKDLQVDMANYSRSGDFDEIDQVVESINVMNLETNNSYGKINQLLVEKNEVTKALEKTIIERTEELEHLLELSLTDGLTGVANRRKFDQELKNEWRRAKRDGTSLSLILLDIDEFKPYNDNYGHPSGDDVLRTVSAAMNSIIQRATDHFCRYGGEEFVLLIANSSTEEALLMAEKLRACVELQALPHKYSSTGTVVTISLGLANFTPAEGHAEHDLLKAADVALYAAKDAGRNCVRLHQGD